MDLLSLFAEAFSHDRFQNSRNILAAVLIRRWKAFARTFNDRHRDGDAGDHASRLRLLLRSPRRLVQKAGFESPWPICAWRFLREFDVPLSGIRLSSA